MKSNRKAFTTPQFSLLSDEQKEDLHLATLEVLKRTGVRVFNEEALDLLRKAGCTITDGTLVMMPAHLVEEAIRTAPPKVTVYNRRGEPAMYLESTNVYYGTGSDLPNVIDPFTTERRKSKKKDVEDAARVCDALPNINFIMSMGLPSDVPIASSDVHSFEAMVTNSTKPIVYTAHDRAGLADIIRMAAVVAGDIEQLREKPFIILYAEPSSPLQHSEEAIDKLLLVAEHNLPVAYVPGSVMAAATPATMAGTFVVSNAELLSGLVIAELKRPGVGFIYGNGTGPMDMKTMLHAYGAPEFMTLNSAMAEMGRYYKLPTWGYSGCSDSKIFDEQAAIEGTAWALMAAMSGTNLVHDVGYVEGGLTCSFEMLVAMDEVHSLTRRLMDGMEVSDETMAVDLIHEIGPGGAFLATDHTLRHFRNDWHPTILDRNAYQEWKERGGKSLGQRANQKARELLEGYQPEALPAKVMAQIAEIVAGSDRRVESTSYASLTGGPQA